LLEAVAERTGARDVLLRRGVPRQVVEDLRVDVEITADVGHDVAAAPAAPRDPANLLSNAVAAGAGTFT
jgi:hypothetical protein